MSFKADKNHQKILTSSTSIAIKSQPMAISAFGNLHKKKMASNGEVV